MNLTNIINAISREMDNELRKNVKQLNKVGYGRLVLGDMIYKAADVKQIFDRAASIVVSREFDKYHKMGTKKTNSTQRKERRTNNEISE